MKLETFFWNNEQIDNKVVNSVVVKIYQMSEIFRTNYYPKVLFTDGTLTYKPKGFQISDYSYVVTSRGIRETLRHEDSPYLVINLYITDQFNPSILKELNEFTGKSYLLEAWMKNYSFTFFQQKLKNCGFFNYFSIDFNFKHIMECLKKNEVNKLHLLMTEQGIPLIDQTLFWMEVRKIAL